MKWGVKNHQAASQLAWLLNVKLSPGQCIHQPALMQSYEMVVTQVHTHCKEERRVCTEISQLLL